MKLIQPNCRAQFTAADMEFILSVFAGASGEAAAVRRLLTDPDGLDELLDAPPLLRAVLEQCDCVSISHHLYFYLLVRSVFREAGLADRTVADYVAELLAEFSSVERVRRPLSDSPQAFDHLVDIVAALQQAEAQDRFLLRVHIGNVSLFLAGIFPRHLEYRAQRRGAPSLSYYEGLGQSSFREAGNHALARRLDLSPTLHTLSDTFHSTRLALNDLTDRLVALGEPDTESRLLT